MVVKEKKRHSRKKNSKKRHYNKKYSKKINKKNIIQNGGSVFGTLRHPNSPNNIDTQQITIVLESSGPKGQDMIDNEILKQEILDVSNINTYDELIIAAQALLDKYNIYLDKIIASTNPHLLFNTVNFMNPNQI